MNIPVLFCKRGQSVFETAASVYPNCRVGLVPDNPPRDGEVLVATVSVSKFQKGFPIYEKKEVR